MPRKVLVTLSGAQSKGRNPSTAYLAIRCHDWFHARKGQVTCHICSTECIRFGSFRNKNRIVQRYRCAACSKTFSETQPIDGTRIEVKQAVQVVRMLAEGCGVRMISRLLGIHTDTIQNILVGAGRHCEQLLEDKIKNVNVEHCEADELFSICGCLQQSTFFGDLERGDQYVYLASDRHTKLVVAYFVGKRTKENTALFLQILKKRTEGHINLSTDAFVGYSYNTMRDVFGRDGINFGTEKKFFAQEKEGSRRYNPRKCLWVKREIQMGFMDESEINTSHAERLNLSFRLFNKRLARKTLCFSKKLENLKLSIALTTAHFNFCRMHSSLDKKTPAMEAGLTDRVWSAEDLLGVSAREMRRAA